MAARRRKHAERRRKHAERRRRCRERASAKVVPFRKSITLECRAIGLVLDPDPYDENGLIPCPECAGVTFRLRRDTDDEPLLECATCGNIL
jgi:hypothetical protein